MKFKTKLIKLLVRLAPLEFLVASIAFMEWTIAFNEDKGLVDGLIIGSDKFVDKYTTRREHGKRRVS